MMAVEQDPDFEHEKWLAERALREREVAVRERDSERSRWSSPVVIAVAGAALAGLFNAGVTLLNGETTRTLEAEKDTRNAALEKSRAEAARVLEMIKVGDTEKAAANLQFLLDSGLISDPDRRIATYLGKRRPGEGPVLAAPGTAIGGLAYSQDSHSITGAGLYRLGDANAEIGLAQAYLTGQGYGAITPDGKFGAQTEAAVRAFQQKNGLPVNGLMGPRLLELAEAHGPSLLPGGDRTPPADPVMPRCVLLTATLEGGAYTAVAGESGGAGRTLGLAFRQKGGLFDRARDVQKSLQLTTQRGACMVFDYLWQRGTIQKTVIIEYERLNQDIGNLTALGADVIEQARIKNFFNAFAPAAQTQPGDYLIKRQLLFVFGKGSFGGKSLSLAGNFGIQLIPAP